MVRLNPRSRPEVQDRPLIPGIRRATKPALLEVGLDRGDGRTTVVMARELGASPTTVWSLLTEPSQLALWAPFTADRDLSRVGMATLTMLGTGDSNAAGVPSVVFVVDPPRELEYGWADDTVNWSVNPLIGGGSLLMLRQTLANSDLASANAAGWHLCLEVAASVLAGTPASPVRGLIAMDHGWADLNRRYAAKLDVVPTQLPGTRG